MLDVVELDDAGCSASAPQAEPKQATPIPVRHTSRKSNSYSFTSYSFISIINYEIVGYKKQTPVHGENFVTSPYFLP